MARVIFLIHESKCRQNAFVQGVGYKREEKKWPFPGAKQIFATQT